MNSLLHPFLPGQVRPLYDRVVVPTVQGVGQAVHIVASMVNPSTCDLTVSNINGSIDLGSGLALSPPLGYRDTHTVPQGTVPQGTGANSKALHICPL